MTFRLVSRANVASGGRHSPWTFGPWRSRVGCSRGGRSVGGMETIMDHEEFKQFARVPIFHPPLNHVQSEFPFLLPFQLSIPRTCSVCSAALCWESWTCKAQPWRSRSVRHIFGKQTWSQTLNGCDMFCCDILWPCSNLTVDYGWFGQIEHFRNMFSCDIWPGQRLKFHLLAGQGPLSGWDLWLILAVGTPTVRQLKGQGFATRCIFWGWSTVFPPLVRCQKSNGRSKILPVGT